MMHAHGSQSKRQQTGAPAFIVIAAFCTAMAAGTAVGDEVGDVSVDWLGGDIKIEAIEDPKVSGVTCHVSYFDRGLLDRLRNGQIFSDPSNSAIDCRQTGPIVIGDIDLSSDGESVFSQRTSLVWKSLKVTRIYDKERDTLLYLSHASQVADGSAKMDLSTIPLFDTEVEWEK
jgi:CreA protein